MKINRLPELALVAVALAALAFASAVNAQYNATGDDRIAASPKVRQLLSERKAPTLPATAALPAMTCPKCADVLTTQVNQPVKGSQVLTGTANQKLATHACAACQAKLTLVGEGKSTHVVAAHKCAADIANPATCCM